MHHDHAKATVGLGLGLPTEVLHTSFDAPKSIGLGLYLGFESWDGLLVSPAPYTDFFCGGFDESSPSSVSFTSEAEPSCSPPVLDTRRARPTPPPDSFWSEHAPMRTPSPSLLAVSTRTPDNSQLVINEPMLSAGYTLPSSDSISSGLSLLARTEEELMGYAPPPEALRPDAGVGLGLSLADMEGPELVHTLHMHGLLDTPILPVSHYAPRSERGQVSPPLLPHLCDRFIALSRVVRPKPRRAAMELAVALDEWVQDAEAVVSEEGACNTLGQGESSTSSVSIETCGLGFGSPFWVSYTAILNGEL